MNNNKSILNALLLPVIVFLTIIYVGFSFNNRRTSNDEYNASVEKLNRSRKAYEDTKIQVDNRGIANGIYSDDLVLKSISINNKDAKNINIDLIKFFSSVYNWHDLETFQSRLYGVRNLLSPELQRNMSVFNQGKMIQQKGSINAERFNSKLDLVTTAYVPYNINNASPNSLDLIANVTYTTWEKGTANQSSNVQWFKLKYDPMGRKIQSIETVYASSKYHDNSNS